MTTRQIKAARALLGWTQADLAREAGLGTATVADIEREARIPHPGTIMCVSAAFRNAGVTFTTRGVEVR